MTPDDLDTLVRTVYGEARGEPLEGKIAVVHVVLNRVKLRYRGTRVGMVCRWKSQFSCWRQDDPNRSKVEFVTLSDQTFRDCYRAVMTALETADPTNGATHYFNPRDANPVWARDKEPCAKIGNHCFFKEIP